MVFERLRHCQPLGQHRPATSFSDMLGLAEVVRFISRSENRHGRNFQIPNSEDSVRILTNGQTVWFGVISQRQISGVKHIGKVRQRELIRGHQPPQLPAESVQDNIKGWWVVSRALIAPDTGIRLVYLQ